MTEFEINFDLILLYLNLLGLYVVIIIENINPSVTKGGGRGSESPKGFPP